jgi:DNA-binding transcriptional ArsR family regulator
VNRRASIADELLLPVVEQLRVMGQVVRLRLIECLAMGDATPHELADDLGLSQQNVSKHLQILYRAGLVKRRRDGTIVLYSLADEETVVILDEIVARVSAQIAELSRLASPGRRDEGSGDAGRTGE